MSDFNVRSDSVNVEHIMEQVRSRIREKRGIDYTEDQIREMATVKLEKFLDSRAIRSDLLEEFRRAHGTLQPAEFPNYSFEEQTLFESNRAPVRWIRRLLLPVLKLFFNPNPLIKALHIQSTLNTMNRERDVARHGIDQLHYELLHNLVVETTRMGIDLRNLQMRVESLASRLEFNERRARALESVVVYRPPSESADTDVAPEVSPAADATPGRPLESPGRPQEGPGQRSRRRRRRRGRRGGPSAAAIMGGHSPQGDAAQPTAPSEQGASTPEGSTAPAKATPQPPSPPEQ
jgi:hypothetical protein